MRKRDATHLHHGGLWGSLNQQTTRYGPCIICNNCLPLIRDSRMPHHSLLTPYDCTGCCEKSGLLIEAHQLFVTWRGCIWYWGYISQQRTPTATSSFISLLASISLCEDLLHSARSIISKMTSRFVMGVATKILLILALSFCIGKISVVWMV